MDWSHLALSRVARPGRRTASRHVRQLLVCPCMQQLVDCTRGSVPSRGESAGALTIVQDRFVAVLEEPFQYKVAVEGETL